MSSRRSAIQEDVHFRVLRLLQENPEWSQRELAAAVGISNGSAHYILDALVEKGLIKLGNFTSSPDKRRYAYVLTPKGIAERAAITRRFLARKLAEYDALKSEIDRLRDELGDEVSADPPIRSRPSERRFGTADSQVQNSSDTLSFSSPLNSSSP